MGEWCYSHGVRELIVREWCERVVVEVVVAVVVVLVFVLGVCCKQGMLQASL